MGLPYLPAFASTFTSVGINVVNGVNYASAGAGILDETGLQLVMSSIVHTSYNVSQHFFCPLLTQLHDTGGSV
jgi:predicted double-glycine peptidase